MNRRIRHFIEIHRKFALHIFLILTSGFLVCTGLVVYPALDGWLFYRTEWEIVQSLAILSLIAIVLGVLTACIIAVVVAASLFFLRNATLMKSIHMWIQRALVGLTGLAILSLFLRDILKWFDIIGLDIGTSAKSCVPWFVVVAVLIGVAWGRDRRRRAIEASDNMFVSKITRRNIATVGIASAAVWATSRVLSHNAPTTMNTPEEKKANPVHPNILLITFDALNAEDMSLYGYHLLTTPNIDRFAEKATIFRQYYSCCTFTTPSIVSLTCGRYLSSTKVYQLYGSLRGDSRNQSLPYVLHQAGYETAASAANLAAHPAITGVGGYDVAPAPPISPYFPRACVEYHEAGFYVDTTPLRDGIRQNFPHIQDILHSIIDKKAKSEAPPVPSPLPENQAFPPEDSFTQAKALWRGLRGQKFLHVHVWAPHAPYQPSAAFRGRFLDPNAIIPLTEGTKFDEFISPETGLYWEKYQPFFDQMRLRYDEWLAEVDTAFGAFMAELEQAGELKNTIVAVSADHGESFQGRVYGHGTQTQLRSIIHVPLVVHMPGQTEKREVITPADAASLAPTLLDLAGIPIPQWMDGASLRGQIDGSQQTAEGFAFTQYFERNSAFQPITKGTIGVIDGMYQYIVELPSGQGTLYELSNAHLHSREISAERPGVARVLRERIRGRFPDIRISA